MTETMRTARAADHPCSLYAYHAPRPVRTQYHHSKPVYLQNRLYGRIVHAADTWLCGTCHDTVHEWLGHLLGESRYPSPEPGWKAKAAALQIAEWYWSERQRLGL